MIQYQIINSCLLKPDHLDLLMQYPSNMFNEPIKQCYIVLQDMYENNIAADLPSFITRAKQMKAKINFDEYMKHVGSTTLMSIRFTLDSIFDDFRKKEIADNATDLFKSIKTGDTDYNMFIDRIIKLKESSGIERDDYFDFAAEQLNDSIRDFNSVKTGIHRLDQKFAGFTNGDLSIIAARPGDGKSTLAFQITKLRNTLFFNLEMPKAQVIARMLQSETGIKCQTILERTYTEQEKQEVETAYKRLQDNVKLSMFNRPFNNIELMSKIKTYNKIKKPELIIIDYIQLISGGDGGTRNEKMTHISNGLKRTALAINKPILALSQLSRGVAKDGRRPELSDLRDSGSLEQDASNVLFIHDGNIIIGKQRIGDTGDITGIKFIKERGNFEEIDYNHNNYEVSATDYIHD